jgi:hypothetical protein
MPLSLLESIQHWSDVQSLLTRTTEQDLTFKYPMARKMLSATFALYRWYRQRNSASKWLGVVPSQSSMTAGIGRSGKFGIDGEDGDIFDNAEPGAEEVSGDELDVVPAEPDTETEFPAGGDPDDALADSDQDEPPMPPHHNNAIFMGPV